MVLFFPHFGFDDSWTSRTRRYDIVPSSTDRSSPDVFCDAGYRVPHASVPFSVRYDILQVFLLNHADATHIKWNLTVRTHSALLSFGAMGSFSPVKAGALPLEHADAPCFIPPCPTAIPHAFLKADFCLIFLPRCLEIRLSSFLQPHLQKQNPSLWGDRIH